VPDLTPHQAAATSDVATATCSDGVNPETARQPKPGGRARRPNPPPPRDSVQARAWLLRAEAHLARKPRDSDARRRARELGKYLAASTPAIALEEWYAPLTAERLDAALKAIYGADVVAEISFTANPAMRLLRKAVA
jgi:hypothetical protein